MQSTGHTSTHDLAQLSTHASRITYGILLCCPMCAVAGKESPVRKQRHRDVVDRNRGFTKSYRDQTDLPRVFAHITGRKYTLT